MAGVYVNQANTSDNWAAGQSDMWSWVARSKGKTQYENHQWIWFWMVDLEYGQSKVNQDPMVKFTDKILTETVGARKITDEFNYYLGLKFESQFASGFGSYINRQGDTITAGKISDFWNPAFLTQSAGLGYSPSAQFSQRIGFALKETWARADRRAFADNPSTNTIEKFRIEPGLELITDGNYEFNNTVKWNTTFRLFANFQSLKSTDLSLDNTLVASITDYVEMNFTYNHLYDIDLDTSLQTKQTFSLGLTWNLF